MGLSLGLPLLLAIPLPLLSSPGPVANVNDYLVSVAANGWMPFTVAIIGGVGPVTASIAGAVTGNQVGALPRTDGRLNYLVVVNANARRWMSTDHSIAMVTTVVAVLAAACSSVACGVLLFGGGGLEDIAGYSLSDAEGALVVVKTIVSLVCIGSCSCATAVFFGSRANTTVSVLSGASLPFIDPLFGSFPLIGPVIRVLPFGHYSGWMNSVAPGIARGTLTALVVLTVAYCTTLLYLASHPRVLRLPGSGEL